MVDYQIFRKVKTYRILTLTREHITFKRLTNIRLFTLENVKVNIVFKIKILLLMVINIKFIGLQNKIRFLCSYSLVQIF